MLCMVIVLSGSGYLLAETFEEGNAEVMEASVTDVPAEDATVQEETTEAGSDDTVEVEIPAQQEEPSTPAAEAPAAEAPAAETPAAEVPAVESAEPILQLTYEDDDVKVIVDATKAGNIPDGATLSVTPLEKKEVTDGMSAEEKAKIEEVNAQYDLTETKLQEKAENEEYDIAGFLAYDITFVDADGNKLEPNGDVKVSMEYKKAVVPEEVKQAKEELAACNAELETNVTVMHLEENANGTVREVVDMVADANEVATVQMTGSEKVQKVELMTDSFSVFTITWGGKASVKGYIIDEDGKDIKGIKDKSISASGQFNFTQNIETETNSDYYKVSDSAGNTYRFVAAYRTDKDKEGSDRITKGKELEYINYSEGKIKYQEKGKDKEKEFGNKRLYLVYKLETPAQGNVDIIPTVNASELGINIDLFNYNDQINRTNIADAGFSFYNGFGGGAVDGTNTESGAYTHPNAQGVHQEYLKANLQKGYPVLKDGTSLGLLFGSTTSNAVTPYTGLDGLLLRPDEAGYYVYDSSVYHAQLLKDKNRIEVYNAKLSPDWNTFRYGNFLPFNSLPSSATNGSENSVDGGRSKTDLWYGMHISMAFMQPKNGTLNGNPMEFAFTGDDDVWVFIDGVKVLDIGGIHDKKSGNINFQTGVVNVDDVSATTLSNLYKVAYQEKNPDATNEQVKEYLDSIFATDSNGNYTTYKNYSGHNMDFFYLERGGGAANCKIKFNMPALDKDSVTVSKEIENYDEGAYNDVEFSFKMYHKGELVPEGTTYTLIKADGTESAQSVGKDGVFKLKHGEHARFADFTQGDEYYVEETGISSATYDKVKIESSGIVNEEDQDITEGETSVRSKVLTVGENYTVTFRNRCAATNMKHLIIKKAFDGRVGYDTYQMRVTVGGALYTGNYKVGDDYSSALASDELLEAQNGIIRLRADQVAVILGNASISSEDETNARGIPSGTSFKVEELLEDNGTHLQPKYEVSEQTAENINAVDGFSGTGYASGTIILNSNASVTVTNTLVGNPAEDDKPDDVPHHKYIDYLGDGVKNSQTGLSGDDYYRLYLDVTGIPNVKPEPADIVLVLDYSSSMGEKFGGKTRWDYVKNSAQIAVNTLLPDGGNSKNRVGIVWFDGEANKDNVQFTSDRQYLLNCIDRKNIDYGTNYQAAFWNAQDMLKNSSGRKKFVIFVTDGKPYHYYKSRNDEQDGKDPINNDSEAQKKAIEAAKLFNDLNGFYAVSVGSEDGTTFLKNSIVGNVNATTKTVIGADKEAELTNAFNLILGSITKQIGNVTITDTLSEYVTFVDEQGEFLSTYDTDKYGIIQGKNNDNIASQLGLKVNTYNKNKETGSIIGAEEYTGSYAYKIDLNNKTITVNFGEDYFLERDVVYTISFNVRLTEKATKEALEEKNTSGDDLTDYPGNVTSSKNPGLYSNSNTSLSYERVVNGEKRTETQNDYEKPVVQPYDKTWILIKENKGGQLQLQGAQFTLSKTGKTYTGTSDENGVVQWKDGDNKLNSSQDIEPGTYTLTETKAPAGYSLTTDTWTVEIYAKRAKPVITCETTNEKVQLEQDLTTGYFKMKVKNEVLYSLPSAGGSGIFWYTIGGILLMMAAALILYKNKCGEVLNR